MSPGRHRRVPVGRKPQPREGGVAGSRWEIKRRLAQSCACDVSWSYMKPLGAILAMFRPAAVSCSPSHFWGGGSSTGPSKGGSAVCTPSTGSCAPRDLAAAIAVPRPCLGTALVPRGCCGCWGTLGLPVWHLACSHACWWVPTEGPSLGEEWGLSMEAGTPTPLPLARAAPWVLQHREPRSCSGSCRAPTGWGNQRWDRVLRDHTRAPLLSSPTVHSPGYWMV